VDLNLAGGPATATIVIERGYRDLRRFSVTARARRRLSGCAPSRSETRNDRSLQRVLRRAARLCVSRANGHVIPVLGKPVWHDAPVALAMGAEPGAEPRETLRDSKAAGVP